MDSGTDTGVEGQLKRDDRNGPFVNVRLNTARIQVRNDRTPGTLRKVSLVSDPGIGMPLKNTASTCISPLQNSQAEPV